jgi:hypothetical protein
MEAFEVFTSTDHNLSEQQLVALQEIQIRAWGRRVLQLMDLFQIRGTIDGKRLLYPNRGNHLEASIDRPLKRYIKEAPMTLDQYALYAIVDVKGLPRISDLNDVGGCPDSSYATSLQIIPRSFVEQEALRSDQQPTVIFEEDHDNLPTSLIVQGETQEVILLRMDGKEKLFVVEIYSESCGCIWKFTFKKSHIIRQFRYECSQRKRYVFGDLEQTTTDLIHGYTVGIPTSCQIQQQTIENTAMVRLVTDDKRKGMYLLGVSLQINFSDSDITQFTVHQSRQPSDIASGLECAVCLETMDDQRSTASPAGSDRHLWTCKVCKNGLHFNCWNAYISSQKPNTCCCPYCRTLVVNENVEQ